MISDDLIAEHYDQADLVDKIRAGLEASGVAMDAVTIDDLALVDEFHTGGRAATEALIGRLGLAPEAEVLDVGCGLGGAARYCATHAGCRVTGVDLTPSYVEAAAELTAWVGLDDRVSFHLGSGAELPFKAKTFDAAYLLHVGMNVADKTGLFAGIGKVLKGGGAIGVYDLMRTGDEPLVYPMPWATTEATSLVATPDSYQRCLADAGFEVTSVVDQRELAIAVIDGIQAGSSQGPPPLGLHLLMGGDIGAKLSNLVTALRAGTLSPIEIIAHRPS